LDLATQFAHFLPGHVQRPAPPRRLPVEVIEGAVLLSAGTRQPGFPQVTYCSTKEPGIRGRSRTQARSCRPTFGAQGCERRALILSVYYHKRSNANKNLPLKPLFQQLHIVSAHRGSEVTRWAFTGLARHDRPPFLVDFLEPQFEGAKGLHFCALRMGACKKVRMDGEKGD
jgi:hypothetical protein